MKQRARLFDLPGLVRFAFRWVFRTPWTARRLLVAAAFFLLFPLFELLVWAGLWWDEVLFSGYRRRRVERPVFIAGNPRSGTTFLHRLLSRDRRFTTMKMWEVLFAPSVSARRVVGIFGALDRVLGRPLTRGREHVEDVWREQNVMHRVSLNEPEEDDYLLLHAWSALTTGLSSGVLSDALPYTYFDSALPKPRRDRILGFYHRCLARHLHAHRREPGDTYLAKNPALCPKLETLYEHFPDARVIYLARNPLEMLPSYVSMMEFSWRAVGLPVHGKHRRALHDYLFEMAGHWYRHGLEVVDRTPEHQAVVVRYDDLVTDPDRTVRRIYERFRLEVDDHFAEVLRRATETARRYESRHDYGLDELGLSRERIESEFADVFERFGFASSKTNNGGSPRTATTP